VDRHGVANIKKASMQAAAAKIIPTISMPLDPPISLTSPFPLFDLGNIKLKGGLPRPSIALGTKGWRRTLIALSSRLATGYCHFMQKFRERMQ